MRRTISILRCNRVGRAALLTLAWAVILSIPIAAAAALPSAPTSRSGAVVKPPSQSQTTTTTPTTPTTTTTTTTTTTPTTPTTTTTPTTPTTTPTTPYTQPTTIPYTPPPTTPATTVPLTTPTPAPPPVVHKPKPVFHFDPPRVRLSDGGVAQRGAILPLRRTSAISDPTSTPSRVKMIVLIAVGLGLLLALAAALRVFVRHRRLAGVESRRLNVGGGHLPARREFFRVYGDRMRVAFDDRGADVLIVGLGLAAAVALAALVVG